MYASTNTHNCLLWCAAPLQKAQDSENIPRWAMLWSTGGKASFPFAAELSLPLCNYICTYDVGMVWSWFGSCHFYGNMRYKVLWKQLVKNLYSSVDLVFKNNQTLTVEIERNSKSNCQGTYTLCKQYKYLLCGGLVFSMQFANGSLLSVNMI